MCQGMSVLNIHISGGLAYTSLKAVHVTLPNSVPGAFLSHVLLLDPKECSKGSWPKVDCK